LALGIAAAVIGCGEDKVPGEQHQPFEPVAPATYVAKVKNILVGLPPTADEIAAVEADPTALPGLVDTWMQLPEYQQKMLVFFQLAFQQTQITQVDFVNIIPPNGLANGAGAPMLVQNASESFARTVLQLQAEGRPLTEAFTTKRVMMTPALMSIYAFMDERTVDDDAAITDSFQGAHRGETVTIEQSAGPIAWEDTADPTSPSFMHFYDPELAQLKYQDTTCNGQDPVTFKVNSLQMLQFMVGQIPNHLGPQGQQCGQKNGTALGVQYTADDYTSWKMVTIRAPQAGEKPTLFFDLAKMRSAQEIVLNTPHPGFYSTPAFFANWPTNSSNQHRVTLNQALIVATGAQIDGTDDTTPTQTPGLDTTHAQAECIGCHQLLDPTRSILSSTYSWFDYPQTDNMLIAQKGEFAFEGVIQPMASIDDFGNLLATHPLVAGAWAQKLCYYANSSPCDNTDPEFLRIVGDFKTNNFSWNALVRELLSSPITTHASETKTADTNGEVIAVARRDHLCAAINSRLGFVDVCELDATLVSAKKRKTPSTIAQIVGGLPSDGYGRGATIPILPNEASLFYRSGLENICESLATATIDATPDPMQPGAKQWSSAQPDAAIADFVALVMALVPTDPRSAQATDVLQSHFTAAKATGASATDSLRSTFTVACLSPSFIGIGL
jgi:hypothetical protein